MHHAYYVTWLRQTLFGPEKISGPHLWFTVPLEQANPMDLALERFVQSEQNPYRDGAFQPGRVYFKLNSVDTSALPPPAAPNPNDPTFEEIP